MNKTSLSETELKNSMQELIAEETSRKESKIRTDAESPVHVVYGGAHLYSAETTAKLGRLALGSLENFAPDFIEFAEALWLPGADLLPKYRETRDDLQSKLEKDPLKIQTENFPAWLAWTIYRKTLEKLKTEPVEDFRIDFEDGYGIRADEEEDRHASAASNELARAFLESKITRFSGFRIKSFQTETRRRAVRTLDLFLTNFLEKTSGRLPRIFVVTLPKVRFKEETEALERLLDVFEKKYGFAPGTIKIEILIETPEAVLNMREIFAASSGRLVAAHFGAYDYTSSFGITAVHQHLRHDACRFARQLIQIQLAPLGVRLSDSVTTEMPVPVHRGENLSAKQSAENLSAVRKAWRTHFNNVTRSMIDGFYQSWDLHPAQLVARFAAVYAFFLEAESMQAERLRGFLSKATQALTTGNQFDDLASAEGLLNFFRRGLACGAFEKKSIARKLGLTENELDSATFQEIMEERFERN